MEKNNESKKTIEDKKYKMSKKEFKHKMIGILIWVAIIGILIGTYYLMLYLKDNLDFSGMEGAIWNNISWL